MTSKKDSEYITVIYAQHRIRGHPNKDSKYIKVIQKHSI